jgi:hypothetical protein
MPVNFERDTWLAEVTGCNPATSLEETIYFSNDVGFTTKPTDAPANQFYEPRIKQPVNVTRSIFTGAATLGASRIGYGWLVLTNGDGALDFLIEYGFDGRTVRILHTSVPDPQLSDFVEVLKGTQEQPEFQNNVIRFKLRDDQYKLSVPLQATKYTGAGLGTLEGVAGDLKGKPKPVLYGQVFNIPAPCVETAKLIYQVNDGAVNSVDNVYVRGVAVPINDGTYATLADLQNNGLAPAAGHYKSYIGAGGSYFRIGAAPDGLVTADVTEGATAAARTTAQVFKNLLARQAIVPNAADITALDAANPSVIGYWQGPADTTVAEACDEVTASAGAWWGVDRASTFRVKQFSVPTTSPVIAWAANDFTKLPDRLTVGDETKGIPIYRSTVRYQKNYAVQTDVAAAVSTARRAFLERDFRDAVATDNNIKTLHRLAPELAENSLLTTESAAQAEAGRRLTLRGTRRDRLAGEVDFTPENAAVDLGDTVELLNMRYGGTNPVGFEGDVDTIRRRYVVLSIESDADRRKLSVNLWGPNTNQKNLAADGGALFLTDDGKYLITSPE